jgi:hypothetical protein
MSLSTVGYPALMGAQLSKIIMPHYAAALQGRKDILEDTMTAEWLELATNCSTKSGAWPNEDLPVRCECRAIRSRVEWMEKARKLEDLGYATLTVPDHLSDFFAPMPALISAVEATQSVADD